MLFNAGYLSVRLGRANLLSAYIPLTSSLLPHTSYLIPHPSLLPPPSPLQADLAALTSEDIDYEANSKSAGGLSMISASSEDIILDVYRYGEDVI